MGITNRGKHFYRALKHKNKIVMEIYKSDSLLNRCVEHVVGEASSYEGQFLILPANIKEKILQLMSKRGTISDNNIAEILYERVRCLDLSDCDITDNSLEIIAHKCSSLRKIDLNSLRKTPRTAITSSGIIMLAEHCRYLSVVYLRRCTGVNDEAISALAQNCPLLRDLNVGGCPLITDVGLRSLGEHAKNLSSINLTRTNITDYGVIQLVEGPGGRQLKELHLAHCEALTDDSMEAVTQFCPNINILLFHGCPNISERSREAMEQIQSPMKQVTWTIY